MYSNQLLEQLSPELNNFFSQVITFIGNNIFGIIALFFWLRVIVLIVSGRTSVTLIVIAVIFTALAISAKQAFWL